MSLRPRSLVSLLIVAIATTPSIQGCSTWTVAQGNPAAIVAADPARQYRVSTRLFPPVLLRDCRVTGDTLTGRPESARDSVPIVWDETRQSYRAELPVASISRMEYSRLRLGRTALLLSLVYVVASLSSGVSLKDTH